MFSSAGAYDRWIGRYSPALARELAAAAGVRAGASAVDVGCGPGALTVRLAELLGAANVAAADPSEPFARECRRRVPGARVEVARAEALPFADAAFDHALAQLVVNFIADPAAGVAEMRRVTRPGGTVAAAVWDYAGEMTLLRAFWDAAVALDPAAATRDEGRAMPFCSAGELERLWRSVGLADVSVAGVVVAASYDGLDDLWAPLEQGVGPAGAYVAGLDPGPRAALRAAVGRRLDAGDGPFGLTARAWVAVGRVP
jgi:SAM-dependent methyltransferase